MSQELHRTVASTCSPKATSTSTQGAPKDRSASAFGSSSVPTRTLCRSRSSLPAKLPAGKRPTRRPAHAPIYWRIRNSALRTRTRGTRFAGCMFDTCMSRSRCDRRCWRSTSPSSPKQSTTSSTRIECTGTSRYRHGRHPFRVAADLHCTVCASGILSTRRWLRKWTRPRESHTTTYATEASIKRRSSLSLTDGYRRTSSYVDGWPWKFAG